jgi:hypothetical protein
MILCPGESVRIRGKKFSIRSNPFPFLESDQSLILYPSESVFIRGKKFLFPLFFPVSEMNQRLAR